MTVYVVYSSDQHGAWIVDVFRDYVAAKELVDRLNNNRDKLKSERYDLRQKEVK